VDGPRRLPAPHGPLRSCSLTLSTSPQDPGIAVDLRSRLARQECLSHLPCRPREVNIPEPLTIVRWGLASGGTATGGDTGSVDLFPNLSRPGCERVGKKGDFLILPPTTNTFL
jgi:hypothetical protein